MHRMTKLCFLFLLLVIAPMFCAPSFAQVSVGIAITVAPPELPVYDQPECPGEDYIWTPGYWAWGDDDYYWVPGTWVLAPEPGYFWTPGYWEWRENRYFFNAGYWGPVIGFYGGINYGFGYFGRGYEGGRWERGHFFYNRSVNNVNVTVIHNTYNTTIINRNVTVNRVSYNGGSGGIAERPNAQEETAARERHIPPVAAQTRHFEEARANPELRASVNHGRPPIAATPRPAEFKHQGVVAAREGGAVHGPGGRVNTDRPPNNMSHPNPATHAKEITPPERIAPPNTGNPKLDKKYQQQQEKIYAQQERDRQNL